MCVCNSEDKGDDIYIYNWFSVQVQVTTSAKFVCELVMTKLLRVLDYVFFLKF